MRFCFTYELLTKENLEIEVSMYDGEILGITLPEKVDYEVIETTDAVK